MPCSQIADELGQRRTVARPGFGPAIRWTSEWLRLSGWVPIRRRRSAIYGLSPRSRRIPLARPIVRADELTVGPTRGCEGERVPLFVEIGAVDGLGRSVAARRIERDRIEFGAMDDEGIVSVVAC